MRILYIDIDAQRPDSLGCYGYHRPTSPHIDAIAAEGLRCEQFYTSDAPCLPSRTALYAGRFGIQTGVVGHGRTAAQPKVQGMSRQFRDSFEFGLAGQLQKAGFRTSMISPFGQRHSAHWFYAGFNEIHNTGLGGMESAEHVMPTLDAWLDRNLTEDQWYLHLNFWDPHTPYRVPEAFGNPFKNHPLPKHLDDDAVIARHIAKTGPHSASDLGMYTDSDPERWPRVPARITDRDSLRKWIDGYDTAVRYVDEQIGHVVRRLKEAGIYDDTAIIISADHGENQGELGIYGEHGTADNATCRIPMIIKWPGGVKGAVDTRFHYNVDLAPTLIDLVGGRKQDLWDGESFAANVLGRGDVGHEDLVLSQGCHVCQRSVRFDHWLYMRTYHDGFHLFPDEMLFDLASDPYEQHDVAARHPEICREGAWRLARWHDAQMKKMAANLEDMTDPLWTVYRENGPYHATHTGELSPLPKYLERLEATGRTDGAAALRARYGVGDSK